MSLFKSIFEAPKNLVDDTMDFLFDEAFSFFGGGDSEPEQQPAIQAPTSETAADLARKDAQLQGQANPVSDPNAGGSRTSNMLTSAGGARRSGSLLEEDESYIRRNILLGA